MRLSVLIATLLLACVSCKLMQGPKTGDVAYKEQQYTVAASLYEKELSTEKDEKEIARKSYMIAEAYRQAGNYVNAATWYKKALDAGADDESQFQYAEMLKMNENYDEAIVQLKAYVKKRPDDDDRVRVELNACNLSKQWHANAGGFHVRDLESINTSAFDYAPVAYKKGIVFTSDRPDASGNGTFGWTGLRYSDLYYTERDAAGNFTAPVSFSKTINTPYNEGVITFTKDFSECYFTRCGSNSSTNDYCHIYHSTWDAAQNEWTNADELDLFTNDSVNEQQPCLSLDGNDLYFSCDAKGGYGGKDLYVTHKQSDATWSEPVNLGSKINTPGNEEFPHISDDGKLYFSSDGLPGMGGLDIFVCSPINGGGWSKPQNMRYPINSGGDDFGIMIVPLTKAEKDTLRLKGYFCSNRPGGKGNDDIYEFSLRRNKLYGLNGMVYSKKLLDPTDALSQIIGFNPLANTKVAITEYDTIKKTAPVDLGVITTDSTGRFSVLVKPDRKYKLTATNEPDYFTQTEYVNTNGINKKGLDTVYVDAKVVLDKIIRNVDTGTNKTTPTFYTLSNIYYGLDSATLRPLSKRVLDTLAGKLAVNPHLVVELGSHTDCRGSHEHNVTLSQARAQAAVDYLISKGIAKDRLVAKGYADSIPVEQCPVCKDCTEAQHQKNRRTTFRILGTKTDIKSGE